jgi:uncharacterized protein
MKRLFFLLLLVLGTAAGSMAQSSSYDKALADSLGADDYGMHKYYLVLLKTGKAKPGKEEKAQLLRGHLDNIGRLVSAGKLIVAGPFTGKGEPYRGIFILKTATREEADALLGTDPAIKAGLFSTEVLEWYGSAALPLYLPYHSRVEKEQH